MWLQLEKQIAIIEIEGETSVVETAVDTPISIEEVS